MFWLIHRKQNLTEITHRTFLKLFFVKLESIMRYVIWGKTYRGIFLHQYLEFYGITAFIELFTCIIFVNSQLYEI